MVQKSPPLNSMICIKTMVSYVIFLCVLFYTNLWKFWMKTQTLIIVCVKLKSFLPWKQVDL